MVINGAEIQTGRDAQSLLTTICSAFNESPDECSQALSSASPAPGFGFDGTDTSGATGGCGV